LIAWQGVEDVCGKATAFRAEQKGVTVLKAGVVEGARAFCGKSKQPRMTDTFQATGEVGVGLQRGELVIIEPGPAQALVIQLEAQRLDQMQGAASIGA